MKMTKKHNLSLISVAVALILSGCSTAKIDEAKEEVVNKKKESDRLKKQSDSLTRTNTTAEVHDSYFIADLSFDLTEKDRAPNYFNDNVNFNQQTPVSIREILDLITSKVNVKFEVTEDAIAYIEGRTEANEDTLVATGVAESASMTVIPSDDSSGIPMPGIAPDDEDEAKDTGIYEQINRSGVGSVLADNKVTFEHQGTLREAIDLLTQKLDVSWKWETGKVVIFRAEVKNYIFDGANISTSLDSSTSSTSQTDTSASSISSSVNLSTNKMFDEITDTIQTMLSNEGGVNINSNTGVITVNDIPAVQTRVKTYIDKMNAIVNKRIYMKTQIVEIVSDDSGDYGIDFDAVFSGSSKYGLSFGGVNPLDSSVTIPGGSGIGIGVIDESSNWNGSKAMVNMMSEYNNSVTVRDFSVNTQNGQVVPFQIIDKIKYLEKLTTTVEESEDGGDPNVESSMEIGEVIPGFSMNLLPRVTSKNDVSLQVLMNVNTLNKFEHFTTEDGESQSFMPHESQQQFSQAVTIRTGNTLMLTGFEESLSESNVKSLAGEEAWVAGGNKSGGKKTKMTIVLITPYIMAR